MPQMNQDALAEIKRLETTGETENPRYEELLMEHFESFLHTGKGTNSSTDLYWGNGWHVWNNTGDKAILRDSSSNLKDTCSWGDGNGIRYC